MSTTIRPTTTIRPSTTIRTTTTSRRPGRRSRLAVLLAAAAMALAACGGGTDADTGGDAADDVAGLPTNDATTDDGPVTSGMCIEDEPDCEDMIVNDGSEPLGDDGSHDGSTSSCLVGDEDCTDESYDGTDAATPIPTTAEPSRAEPAALGQADGASGVRIDSVHVVDETTLEVTWSGGACDVVQDVLVQESPAEVRLLVLAGIEVGVEACTQQVMPWSIDVQLDEPLGDRTILDLGG